MMGIAPRLVAVLLLHSLHLGAVLSNNIPSISFSVTNNFHIVSEDKQNGTELFTVTATDADPSDTISITTGDSETGRLVTLDLQAQSGTTRSARVLLQARLDRDRSPPNRQLWFTVSDGQFEISGMVMLIITDVNDNPPFFEDLPYRLELPERTTNKTNTTVYTVSASDPDSGPSGSVVYSLEAQAQGADSTYNTTFVIADPRSGEIRLEQELDYETRSFYQYKVFARDLGNPPCPGELCRCNNFTEPEVTCQDNPATFTVTVKDVQDTPPLFEHLPYITQLWENTSIDTSVYSVSARDGDTGVPNNVNYTIVDGELYPFSMEPDTGIITLIHPGLDADTPDGRSYLITVMATEIEAAGQEQFGQTNATTQVSITVLDVNDNAPQFGEDVYYATVQENTHIGVPIRINRTIDVTDKDQNTNSRFRLSVERDGAPYPVFSTLPSAEDISQGFTTVMISVNDSTVLDFEETQSITFQIRATETETSEKFSNLTTIVLTILDMNDNSPRFPDNQTTLVNVSEDAANGTVLATFNATDRDSGDFGTIAFSLENDFGGTFEIDEKTGQLKKQGALDRDSGQDRFPLVVVAKDDAGAKDENQRRSARHVVQVVVEDVNDNSPVFRPHQPRVAVQENAEINTTLMTLTATDPDQAENGEVRYHVSSIRPASSPTPQPPVLFDIRETTGEVFVSASLIGHPGSYNVTFRASDRGAVPLSAATSLVVEVKDVNVNPPKFVYPDQDDVNTTANVVPNITIYEEEEIGTFIAQLMASDADTGRNGQVHFYLDPDLDSAFLNFQVDPTSGNLSNRARLDCDRGTGRLQINLRAQDQGEPLSLSSVVPFIVYLRDIDDNPPQFAQGGVLTLSVQEQASDVTVGFVNVSTDRDRDPENRLACYYLYGGELLSSFSLNKTSGELRLLTKLDRTQTRQVNLQVKATRNCSLEVGNFTSANNNGSSSSSSSRDEAEDESVLRVRVEVEDINDHPPVFDKDALTVGLLYDVAVGTEVTNLATYTSDEDTAEHSKHQYRLLKFWGPNSGPGQPVDSTFSVSANGSVATRRLFRADEGGNFVLTVQAFDADNLTDTANLTIYLVSNLMRVKLIFNKDPNEVNRIKGKMVRRLGDALGVTIIADKVATHINTDGTPDPKRTDVFIHARYKPSGDIVPTSELVNAFDYNQLVVGIFQDYGVAYTSSLEKKEESGDSGSRKVFIIVIVALVIISVALVLVLITSIRRYRLRLKAATTSAFVTTQDLPNSKAAPGTNKYLQSENPLFGKDMKPEDFDRVLDKDNDSLDENAVDGGSGPEPREEEDEEQEMYLDMYDDDLGPGAHRSTLALVLEEYDSHNVQHATRDLPNASTPTSNGVAAMLGGRSEARRGGHAKSDSGLSERSVFDCDLHHLQHSDI